jgi:hypothetical protein
MYAARAVCLLMWHRGAGRTREQLVGGGFDSVRFSEIQCEGCMTDFRVAYPANRGFFVSRDGLVWSVFECEQLIWAADRVAVTLL